MMEAGNRSTLLSSPVVLLPDPALKNQLFQISVDNRRDVQMSWVGCPE